MAYIILRAGKLKTNGNIAGVGAHLRRTRDTPNADPELTHLNEILRGSTDLLADVNSRLDEVKAVNGELRKNAVLAIEHLITFSPDFVHFSKDDGDYFPRSTAEPIASLQPDSQVDADRLNGFIDRTVAWLDKRYGPGNVVNVQLHLDESTPHIHAVVVPVDERGKLNCRAFLGGRKLMSEMQTSIAEEMAPLGLVRGVAGSKAEHQDVQRFYTLANELAPGLANEVVQAKLQASEKDRQKDLNPPLSATIYYHNEEVGASMAKELRKLDLRILTIDPIEQTIKVEYSTESQGIDKIHNYFGLIKEADNHIEESGAHFRERGSRAMELELTREKGLGIG
ncbi:MAG: plasmid recombination protein [Bacteroidota bacterium]|nr:plasmid recombination protein [Bacteroidota bacterium]